MSLRLSSILLGGVPLDLDEVAADVTIRHGRVGVYDDPQAASCQLVLLGVDHAFSRAFQTGAPLVVNALIGSGGELLQNPGAESGVVAPWFAINAHGLHADASSHSGAWAFQFTADGGYAGIQQNAAAAVPVPEGAAYRLEAWVFAYAGVTVGKTVTLMVYGAGGAVWAYGQFALAVGWNHYSFDLPLALPGQTLSAVAIYTVDSAAGDEFWIDDVSFHELERPRFTGRITDGALDVDELTAIAVGRLSTLSQYPVGAVDWPAETWSARVTRAFTEAGIQAYLELIVPPVNPQLAARPASEGTVSLDQYLGELAAMIGAAVVDRPDGRILVQPLSARTLAALAPLDPDEVEYAPGWVQVLPEGNRVTCKWTGGEETVEDPASIAIYGPIPTTIQTDFTTAQAAHDRAAERLARTAYPHWNMPAAPLTVGRTYKMGAPVELTEMPAASPYDPWTPVVEGWTDTISAARGELTWQMELALSDPLASGLTLPWSQAPLEWNTIAQATAWRDALTLDSLTP